MLESTCKIRFFKLVKLFVLFTVLAGCAGTDNPGRRSSHRASNLDNWVDNQLTPYLVEQLSRQPRFRNEPLLLVAMRDADLQPHIDSLTRSIREKLQGRLLQTNGVHIAWRPNSYAMEHHRAATNAQCQTASNVRYFVSIDIVSREANKVRVDVRALDIGAGSWVSGFGKSWQGKLTRTQQQALGQRRTDEYLRGLRVLPFGTGESDLAAAYLAQNIACVLRGQQALQAKITIEKQQDSNPALKQVLTLVSHNLTKLRGKPGNPDTAQPLALEGSLSKLDDDLYQLWVSVIHKDKAKSEHLLDTSVYLSAITDFTRKTSNASPVQPDPLPGSAGNESEPESVNQGVLSTLRLTGTDFPAACPGHDRGNCLSIEYDLYQPAYVLLLRQGVDSGLVWMPADGCGNLTDYLSRLSAQQTIVAIDVGPATDTENIFAIAVKNRQLAHRLWKHAQLLPGACIGEYIATRDTDYELRWLAELDLLLEPFWHEVDWQSINLAHVTNP